MIVVFRFVARSTKRKKKNREEKEKIRERERETWSRVEEIRSLSMKNKFLISSPLFYRSKFPSYTLPPIRRMTLNGRREIDGLNFPTFIYLLPKFIYYLVGK